MRYVIVSILFSTIKSILAAAHNIVCYDAHGVLVHIYSRYHLSLIGNTYCMYTHTHTHTHCTLICNVCSNFEKPPSP